MQQFNTIQLILTAFCTSRFFVLLSGAGSAFDGEVGDFSSWKQFETAAGGGLEPALFCIHFVGLQRWTGFAYKKLRF